nr:ATP synthase F0 subunit 8 [Monomorium triviale]
MPQMMPLLWLIMMIMLIIILLMLTSFIYYLYIPNISMNNNFNKIFKITNKNWKWLW